MRQGARKRPRPVRAWARNSRMASSSVKSGFVKVCPCSGGVFFSDAHFGPDRNHDRTPIVRLLVRLTLRRRGKRELQPNAPASRLTLALELFLTNRIDDVRIQHGTHLLEQLRPLATLYRSILTSGALAL